VLKVSILALLSSFLLCLPLQALTLSPGTLKIQSQAGEKKSLSIRVFNESKQPVWVTPSVEDWSYGAKGDKIFRPPGTFPFSLAPYVEIEAAPFLLEPRQSKQVSLHVAVPADKLGGHHAIAFFHAVPYQPQPQKQRSQVKMAIRLGTTLLYENPESSVIQSRIRAAEVQSRPTGLQVRLKIQNDGNTWLDSSATVAVMDNADNFLGTFKLPRQILLRGQQAELVGEWKRKLKAGTYRILITYQYREQSTTIARTLTVS